MSALAVPCSSSCIVPLPGRCALCRTESRSASPSLGSDADLMEMSLSSGDDASLKEVDLSLAMHLTLHKIEFGALPLGLTVTFRPRPWFF